MGVSLCQVDVSICRPGGAGIVLGALMGMTILLVLHDRRIAPLAVE